MSRVIARGNFWGKCQGLFVNISALCIDAASESIEHFWFALLLLMNDLLPAE